MILITGAAGKTGKAVAQALAERGAPTRAFVRQPAQIAELHACGATEVVVGDLRSADDIERAGQQIDTIYLICPNMQPDEVAIVQRVVAVAKRVGIRRLVYHSVLHPQTEAMPHHWQKLRVEELLFTAGLDYTILQPAAYMQNVLSGWSMIVNEGIYRIPYATSTQLGMVDLGDVAEAAAVILTTEGHNGAIYELATAEWLTQDAVAAILSEVVGRTVRAVTEQRDRWQQNAQKAGLSDYATETLLRMFVYYEAHGFCGNPTILTWLLGRHPTAFTDCMRRVVNEGTVTVRSKRTYT